MVADTLAPPTETDVIDLDDSDGARGSWAKGPWSWALAALGLVISALAMWLAFGSVDISGVGSAIASAEGWMLGLGIVLILCSYPLLALRWRVVASHMEPPPPRTMLEFLLIGTAVNNSLPLRLGELVRGAALARETRKPIMESLGTVIVDRLADVVFFSVALWATLWIVPTPGWVDYVAYSGLALAVLGIGALALATFYLRRRPKLGRRVGKVRHQVNLLILGFRSVRSVRSLAAIGALTAAAWGLWVAGGLVIAESVGAGVSIGGMLFVAGIVGLGSALPSAPGFVGTYHWLLASGLTLQGVGAEEALSAALLVHAAWFFPTTIVGIALALRRGLTLIGVRDLAAEARMGTT